MEISQIKLAAFCFFAVITGFFLGAGYDITAILPSLSGKTFCLPIKEKLSKISLPLTEKNFDVKANGLKDFAIGISVFLHDLFFMCFSGVAVSVFIYRFNDGEWRVYALVFIILGFALYRRFFRLPILAVAELMRFALKYVLAYFAYFALRPIKLFFGKAINACLKFLQAKKAKRTEKNIKIYSKLKKLRLLDSAQRCGILCEREKKGRKNARRKKEKQNHTVDDDISSCGVGHGVGDQSYAI